MRRALIAACLWAVAAVGQAEAQSGYVAVQPSLEYQRQWIAQLRRPPAVNGTAAPIDLGRSAPARHAAMVPPPRRYVVVRPRVAGRPSFPMAQPAVPVRMPGAPAPMTRGFDQKFLPTVVDYDGGYAEGTIVIDSRARYLYLVEAGGKARRYGIGVGREGFGWSGRARIGRKAEWPRWTPPAEMRKRQPYLPVSMEGGPHNPLGARALYLYRNGADSLYRIHGSNEPWTIGRAVSSGCFRMRNEDVVDLYERVPVGAQVVVL